MTRALSIIATFVGLGMGTFGAGPLWLVLGFGGLAVAYLAHAQPRETLAEDAEHLGRHVAGRDRGPWFGSCGAAVASLGSLGCRRRRSHCAARPSWLSRLADRFRKATQRREGRAADLEDEGALENRRGRSPIEKTLPIVRQVGRMDEDAQR